MRMIMQAVSRYAYAIAAVAIMVSVSGGADAQETRLKVPKVIVLAQAVPVQPPYMRDPGKAYARNPYFGRYRVEEDKFTEVPCSATRIALGVSGKCLQGYRLGPSGSGAPADSTNPCDMALDVVIDNSGKLAIEVDILIFDPYKVNANGSVPKWCYVNGYTGYDQEDFQDMNQVTRRGTNWHNLQINDMQDQWHGGDRLRSIEFSDGLRNCIAVRKPGPVWRGGYLYMIHASICRTDTATVQAADVAYVLGSLQTRVYDPVGNLRNANDQTTYGPAGNSR